MKNIHKKSVEALNSVKSSEMKEIERLKMQLKIERLLQNSSFERISENVKRSIQTKLEKGEYVSKAPIGYKNVRRENGKANIVIDSEKAPIIRGIFESYSLGTTSIAKLAKEVNLSMEKLSRILANPFYYGRMKSNGQMYKHIYEPLISEDLFNKCQVIRSKKR